ncbi:MAG: MFS transporter [Deltaproteobacteria bacterium]|nr:MFS transporter [Deltaproteobacteria bacterium]
MKIKPMSSEGFYGWINLCVLFLFNMVSGSLLITFGIYLPFWVNDFAWSRGIVSGAQSANMIIIGIIAPLAGLFIMRFGGKKAIIIGNLINVCGLLLLAFYNEVWQLYVGYGLMVGTGFSLGGVLAMNTIINNWFKKKLSIAVGIATAATGVTGIIIAPLVLYLINSIGWRHTLLFMAAIVMLFCVILPALFVKNRPHDLGQVADGPRNSDPAASSGTRVRKISYTTPVDFTVKEAFRTKTLWLLIGFYTFQYMIMNWFVTHQVTYMFDIGISSGLSGISIGVMSTAMTIAQISAGIMAVRINMQYITLGSITTLIIGLIIAPYASSFTAVLVYSALFGVGFGVNCLVLVNLIPKYYGTSEYPKIMGYITPFNTIIGGVSAPIAGHVRDIMGSYVPAFQVSVLIMAIAFVCILLAKPPVHPSILKKEVALKRKVTQYV